MYHGGTKEGSGTLIIKSTDKTQNQPSDFSSLVSYKKHKYTLVSSSSSGDDGSYTDCTYKSYIDANTSKTIFSDEHVTVTEYTEYILLYIPTITTNGYYNYYN